MVPAKGGASPEAMLLVSMPTGFFSMKLLYMVQALNRNTSLQSTELLGCLVAPREADTADTFTPLC